MKTMMTALTALLLTVATSVFAGETEKKMAPKERPTVEQMARKATERMTSQLKLTDEQAEQVYGAVLERMRATAVLREQERAVKSAEAEKMKSVLSTEQFMRWTESQAPHGRHHGAHHGPQAGKKGDPKERPACDEAPKAHGGKR